MTIHLHYEDMAANKNREKEKAEQIILIIELIGVITNDCFESMFTTS